MTSFWRRGASLFPCALAMLLIAPGVAAGGEVRPALPERPAEALRELAAGDPREIAIQGGESHFFRFHAEAGEGIRVRLEQRGVNVGLLLLAPDGSLLAEINRPSGNAGPELLPAVAALSGTHELELRALVPGEAGSYRLQLAPLAPASAAAVDEASRHRRAWLALEEGQALRRAARSPEALEEALARLAEARELWRGLGDLDQEGAAANSMGVTRRQLGRLPEAMADYAEALALWRRAENRPSEADALYNLGRGHALLGEEQKALEAHRGALAIRRGLGDDQGVARSLTQVASALRELGELDEALASLAASLSLQGRLGDGRGEANTLNQLGILRRERGEEQLALDAFREALSRWRLLGDRAGEAATLNNLGNAYRALGDQARARELYGEVLAQSRSLGDRDAEAYADYHLGWIRRDEGEDGEALASFQRALDLWRQLGQRREEGLALAAVGSTLTAGGRPGDALEPLQASLALAREVENRRSLFFAELHLGEAHLALALPAAAGLHLEAALAHARGLGNVALEATALTALARLETTRGDLLAARSRLEGALAITESLRSRVASEDLRTTYLAKEIDRYGLLIDTLMALHRREPLAGHDRAALAVAERARARSLLDSLAAQALERGAVRQGVDGELLARERGLHQQINARERRRLGLLAGREGTGEGAEALEREVASLLAELADLREEIRRQNPRFSELTEPTPIAVEEVQSQLLDPETLLLVYRLGAERSYLWALGAGSLRSFELPSREHLEALARKAYHLLSAPGGAPGPASVELDRRELQAAVAELSRLLLAPLAEAAGDGAPGPRRLAIVADGALQAVPFAALPWPGTGADAGDLLVRHSEVVFLPSASVLRLLRSGPGREPRPAGTLAVLADPVFSARDGRVRSAPAPGPAPAPGGSPPGEGEREASAPLPYPRLRFSRGEALALAALVPAADRLLALDFDARRELATSGALGGYRLLHLATHGVLDSERPELSGVVLSLVDEAGRPQEGFLRLHDIYSLALDADLVTLSACQTALGREVAGEGLLGLPRGFLYAGARRVVAGLWRVPDKATGELMRRFYQGMLQQGLAPAAALRRAQLALLDDPRFHEPYYWAAFALHGEWRQAVRRPIP